MRNTDYQRFGASAADFLLRKTGHDDDNSRGRTRLKYLFVMYIFSMFDML